MRSLLCACLLFVPTAFAQSPPADDFTLIVPFGPGGGADFVARQLGPALSGHLGAGVDIRNLPGDDGALAARTVLAAAKDGRTLLLGSTASLIAPALVSAERMLNPVRDFDLVALVGVLPRFVAVHRSLPVANLDELIRLARRDPPQIRCGYSDALAEAAVLQFMRVVGLEFRCRDYEGFTPAMRADIEAGRLNLVFEGSIAAELRAGTLRALAVAGASRSALAPDVPTGSEAGVPGLEFSAWLAILAPRESEHDVVSRLQAAAAKALADPGVRTALRDRGYEVRDVSVAQARTFLQGEYEQWQRMQLRRAKKSEHSPTRLSAARPTCAAEGRCAPVPYP